MTGTKRRPERVVVVGAGVSGLTAAYRLRTELGERVRITVCDAAPEPGGKVRTVDLAGRPLDVGAEAFLVRRPEALDLARELGLAGELVHPTGAPSGIRAGGRTRAMPTGTLMGVPSSAEAVAEVLSEAGVRAVAGERDLGPPSLPGDADVSLGATLRARFGDELVDRLVDPLFGGVYAGSSDGLGLRATLPAVAAEVDAGASSLSEAVARTLPERRSTAPVFATLPGGLGELVRRLVDAAAPDLRTGLPVRELLRLEDGRWRVRLGAAAPEHAPADPEVDADAVVLAVPPPAAARLLTGPAPSAAEEFRGMRMASTAVVALALPPDTPLPEAAGVLIAEGESHDDGTPFTAKAFTFSARKWEHHAADAAPVLLRGSVGRLGQADALRVTDDELVRRVRADLAELTGVPAAPVESVVTRWGGALPQYGVGHVERVARIEDAVADVPGLAVAGAALHGMGVPACVATGEAAARRLVGP